MKRPDGRRAGAVAVLALSAVAELAAEDDPRAESTRRMAERLAELAAQPIVQRETPGAVFLANSPWKIPGYRRELAQARGTREVIRLRLALARQLLWDGRTDAALVELAALDAIASGEPERFPRLAAIARPLWVAAQLRRGEQDNCLRRHDPDSCLFPIRRGGRHTETSGSREAVRLLGDMLAAEPHDLAARWLLNLAHMTLGEYPEGVRPEWRLAPELFASEHGLGRFPDVAGRAGVDVAGLAGGVVLEDLDGDGRLDVAVSSWGMRDQLRYLRNEGGGRFADRSREAGLIGEVGGLNLNHADYDGDGDADLFVIRGGWLGDGGRYPNSLLRNDGGRFVDVTEQAGLLDFQPGQTAAWADYDNDGRLDLFVGNETRGSGESHPCRLYHNDGDGTFTDRAAELGLAELGAVKGAAWGDYDNDGLADLYVSRLGQPNLLFRNQGAAADGRWRFSERGRAAGVAEPLASFPTWFWDYDNDGWLDIFVAAWDGSGVELVAAEYLGLETRAEKPRLYRNRGDGRFEDVTRAQRLDRVLLAMGANFGDLDNDGFEDVYVGTGAPALETLMPNRMFRNDAGRGFQDVTTAGGFGHLQKGHGIAFGDVDGDGDQDVYAVMGGWYTGDVSPNALFENPGPAGRWVTLRLRGTRSNRSGVGARLAVVVRDAGGERRIHRVVGTGGSFGSQSLQQEIGLGPALALERLEVRWPASARLQVFEDVAMDRVYVVREDADELEPVATTP